MSQPTVRSSPSSASEARPELRRALSSDDPHPLEVAFLSADLDGMRRTLAPDVELSSPVITKSFAGRDETMRVLTQVLESIDDVRFTARVQDGTTLILAFDAFSNGTPLQGVHLLRLNEQGEIRRFIVHMRPLAGLTAFAAKLGPRIVVRRGGAVGFVRVLGGALAGFSRLADAIAIRLVHRRRA